MGLTIHYKAEFEGTQSELVKRLSRIRTKCLDKPFEEVNEVKAVNITKNTLDEYKCIENCLREKGSNSINEDYENRDKELEKLGLTLDLIINLQVYHKLEPVKVVYFTLWAGEGCEGTAFYFIKNKTNNKWKANSFTKTQYAEHFFRCHLLVIDVLNMLKEEGFSLDVYDEGSYWETRDIKVLAKEINASSEMIAGIAGMLKKELKGTGAILECNIDRSKNIVDIQ